MLFMMIMIIYTVGHQSQSTFWIGIFDDTHILSSIFTKGIHFTKGKGPILTAGPAGPALPSAPRAPAGPAGPARPLSPGMPRAP